MSTPQRLWAHARANAVAYLALMVALGGTSYAAVQLPANSVGAKQIKADAVNSAKVKNGSLKSADFGAGQLPAGTQGPQGPQGLQGPQGPQGTPGSNGTNATINGVPASGDLTGTYPGPTIANGAITPAKIGVLPFFRTGKSAAQAITANTETAVAWDSAGRDNSNMHNPAFNPSRIIIPTAGTYLVSATVPITPGSAGPSTLAASIYQNGFPVARSDRAVTAATAAFIQVTTVLHLESLDYVEIYALSGSFAGTVSGGFQASVSVAFLGRD